MHTMALSNGVEATFKVHTAESATLHVTAWESQIPEAPNPWFEVTADGQVWMGQATDPPKHEEEDGRVSFRVEMRRT